MMKCRILFAAGLFCFSAVSMADGIIPCKDHRLAVQAAMATGGSLGIGLVDFTPKTEWGVTLSGKFNNADNQTSIVTPVLFGGMRQALGDNTYFAFGIDAAANYGRIDGVGINSDYFVGPYISLEQMLTCHVMLAGWIQPYQYNYAKIGGISTSTNSIFATGGVAINYLF